MCDIPEDMEINDYLCKKIRDMNTKSANEIVWVESTGSTNSLLLEMVAAGDAGERLFGVATHTQTAGRGQRGNSWESEPGKNLTMSLLIRRPGVDAGSQFSISEAVSLAVVDALRRIVPSGAVSVKWPNDIYAGDMKICGILIECALSGREILHAVAGIGVNVNQRVFRSDAPNPVSVVNLSGVENSVEALGRDIAARVAAMLPLLATSAGRDIIHERYIGELWRKTGYYPYLETATGRRIMARITQVAPTGHITLDTDDGSRKVYAFKEVAALLEN